MICIQCGAAYEDGLLECPYCHSENRKESLRRKREILEGYDKEAEKIKKEAGSYVKKTAGKWTGRFLAGVGILLAVGAVLTVLYLFGSFLFHKFAYVAKTDRLQKLEEYYQAGDYEALTAYMQEKKLYGREYTKYAEIQEICRELENMERDAGYIKEIGELDALSMEEKWETASYWVKDYLSSAKKALTAADTYLGDRLFWENEEGLEALWEETVKRLQDVGLEEDDITRIVTKEEEALTDLEEKLFELLTE